MAFFDSFTESLKQKWLQFFQMNRDWIVLQMAIESVYTPDGGKRPPSQLILGVVNALEPKLAQLMYPFAKLNPDADILIEVLDLNFDPDIVLGNSVSPTTEPGYSKSGISHEVANQDLQKSNGHSDNSDEAGDFGDMSFDAITLGDDNLDDDGLDGLNAVEETAFSAVLSDVWGDQTSLQQGEELPAGVFDDSEMARLFPNS